MAPLPTPSQTVGPFFAVVFPAPGDERLVPDDFPGARSLEGRITDGAGEPVVDAVLEAWDAEGGRFGRAATDAEGRYRLVLAKPGARRDGQAPHLAVSVFARGLLDRLVTRVYFPDEEAANAADPVLSSLADPDARCTLVARAEPGGGLRFDVRLQGEGETAFFAL